MVAVIVLNSNAIVRKADIMLTPLRRELFPESFFSIYRITKAPSNACTLLWISNSYGRLKGEIDLDLHLLYTAAASLFF
jgi:hypothetical protein